MTTRSDIMAELDRQYAYLGDAVLVVPSALAVGVFKRFSSGEESAQIQYASLEHLKQMAMKYLARHNADSDENPAHGAQMDFEFSGQLQDRYPLPRQRGAEPVYKLRKYLSREERMWNVAQLRKAANARLKHADALEAEGMPECAA